MIEAKDKIRHTDTLTALAEGSVEAAAQAAALPERRERAWRQWLVIFTLIFSDVLLAFLIWGVAFILQSVWGHGEPSQITIASIVPGAVVWVGSRASLGLYPGYGLEAAEMLRRQTSSVAVTLATIAIFALAFQVANSLSRLLLGLAFLILLPTAPLARHFVVWGMMKIGLWGRPVTILGAGEPGKQLMRTLQREWGLGYRPVAVFDFHLAPAGRVLEGVPYGGNVEDALDQGWRQKVDTVIFAMPHIRRENLAGFVSRASRHYRHVIVTPNLGGITTSAVTARNFTGTFGVEIKHNLLNPWASRVKRVLDFILALVGGILILPLFLLLPLLVWLESGGPVFYRDRRVGREGKLFSCVKFRTMVPEAEALLERMLKEDAEMREEYLKYHKLRDDPRVTRVGRFLRKSSLDELPQVWNVLRGEMSLVGPRPYLPRESETVGTMQGEILRVSPGITGPWQVAGRNSTSFSERTQMDAYYVRNWSVWLDLVILARTAEIVIFGRGAY